MKLHDDELPIDEPLVRGLVAAQFPSLAGLALREVRSTGTVNAIYRLGDELAVRLPRARRWASELRREAEILAVVAPRVTLAVPEPVELGSATEEYPCEWAIYRWIAGQPYSEDLIAGERQAATDLAEFVTQMRSIPAEGAPTAGRAPLIQVDARTREALYQCAGEIDVPAALALWEQALRGPAWEGTRSWMHADLLRPNLLVDGGRLHAVIDFGMAGAGDPAHDLIPAWAVFGPAGRAAYREALPDDEATWIRGRGIALHQAAMIIPYYRESNPEFAAMARRTIWEIIGCVA